MLAVLLYYLLPKRCQWMVFLFFCIVFYYISRGLYAGACIIITITTTFYGHGPWTGSARRPVCR